MENQPIHRGYKAILSTGPEIPLDPHEVSVVMRAANQGAIVKVRSGVINPSFLVSIVEDTKRRKDFVEENKYPGYEDRLAQGMKPLKDIFSENPVIKQLQ